eukprot:scaffold5537_cov112-Isochrysis_galbana.AAC.6
MPPNRRRHGHAGGAWLVLAALCAGTASADVMRGFGSGSSSPSDADILVKLQALYAEKLKPLEKKSRQAADSRCPLALHQFHTAHHLALRRFALF